MRALGIVLLCLLIELLYLSSLNISSYSSLVFRPRTRQSMRKLGVSSATHVNEHQKIKVTEEDSNMSKAEESSMTTKRESNDNIDEIVYHTDYHGVTTHPTPTPKHPKP